MIVSKSGYYISYKVNEIPIVASGKSAGVKGINLKDDEVVAGLTYNPTDEYLDIFTNQKTGKRIKLSDLTESSRAKRGSMVIKPVKSTNYEIISALITDTKDIIGLAKIDDVEEIKNTDISILDLASTGSNITKSRFTKAFIIATLKKVDEVPKDSKVKEVKKTRAEAKQEEMDFIDEFKI
jgi:topoisomerase-4 subunit A